MFILVFLMSVSSVALAVLVLVHVVQQSIRRRTIRTQLISLDVSGRLRDEPILPPFARRGDEATQSNARRRLFYSQKSETWTILAQVFVDDYVDDYDIRSIIDRHARSVAALREAAPSERDRQLHIIRFLISRGVEDQDVYLFKAVLENDVNAVRKALELGADPDARMDVVLKRYEDILKNMP